MAAGSAEASAAQEVREAFKHEAGRPMNVYSFRLHRSAGPCFEFIGSERSRSQYDPVRLRLYRRRAAKEQPLFQE